MDIHSSPHNAGTPPRGQKSVQFLNMDNPVESQHTETRLPVHPVPPNAGSVDTEKPAANPQSRKRDLVRQSQPFVAQRPRLQWKEEQCKSSKVS
jgi:hypothetical protein